MSVGVMKDYKLKLWNALWKSLFFSAQAELGSSSAPKEVMSVLFVELQ
jgi:hypothetical protein